MQVENPTINRVFGARQRSGEAMTTSRITKAERVSTVLASDVKLDTSKISATSIITTESRDRSEDIVITSGIDVNHHSISPIVLLEHQHPIGVARTPEGVYTVEKHNGFAIGTTFFDENSPLALQTFRMIDDGILNGASIGFVVRRAGIIQAEAGRVDIKIDSDGDRVPTPKFGLRYDEVELVEYSHTILPDNPEALTVAVQKSRVGSEMMHPALRKLIAPYQIVTPVSVSVPEGVPTDAAKTLDGTPVDATSQPDPITETNTIPTPNPITEKSTVAEDYIPEEEMKQAEPAEPVEPKAEPVEEPGDDLPPGARLLDGLYHRFLEAAQYLEDEGASKRQENPDVLQFVEQAVGQLDEICAMIADQYDALYPDLDSLTGADKSADVEDEPGEEAEEEPEGKRTRRRLSKRIEAYRKRMGKLAPLHNVKPVEDPASKAKVAQMEKSLEKLQKGYSKLLKQFQAARNGR